jgi:hypothetical protein
MDNEIINLEDLPLDKTKFYKKLDRIHSNNQKIRYTYSHNHSLWNSEQIKVQEDIIRFHCKYYVGPGYVIKNLYFHVAVIDNSQLRDCEVIYTFYPCEIKSITVFEPIFKS